MKTRFTKKLNSASKILLASIVFATTGFIGVSLASVSSPIYKPGETLSPTCSPGDLNCGVSRRLDSLTNVKTMIEEDNDILFYDTDGWNRLEHGTDGQVLKYTTDNGLGWGDLPVKKGLRDGSIESILKGPGKITLTNGSTIISGTVEVNFNNYYDSYGDRGFTNDLEIIDSEGNMYILSLNNIISNTSAEIDSTFAGTSGTYDYYTNTASGYFATAFGNSAANGAHSTSFGNSTASGNTSTAFNASTASGAFSTAFGDGSISSTYNSTAFGKSKANGTFSISGGTSTASGSFSLAFGDNSIASNHNSASFGGSTASGSYSTAFGDNSIASNHNSTSFGGSTASGSYSTAFGSDSEASDYNSISFGSSTASGVYSISGGTSTASGTLSTAMGFNSEASGQYSIAMGQETLAKSINSNAIGRYNIGVGISNSWEGSESIFEIGIGENEDNRDNAMTILKNGNVGIGTHTPTHKLEVVGDIKTDTLNITELLNAPTLDTEPTGVLGSIYFNIAEDTLKIKTSAGWKKITLTE